MKNFKATRLWAVGRHGMLTLVSALSVMIWTPAALGQLGMGDSKGIVQQRLKPRLIRVSGRLQRIETHPCESTTGKAELGTHLILKDKDGRELNIHLGPTSEVSKIVKQLTVSTRLDLLGFRTDKMPRNHYVAKTLIFPNHIIQLRDSDLRPYWSTNKLGQQGPSPFVPTIGKRRTSETAGSLGYHPKYRPRRCLRDGVRPRWRRRCRGRACGRRWT